MNFYLSTASNQDETYQPSTTAWSVDCRLKYTCRVSEKNFFQAETDIEMDKIEVFEHVIDGEIRFAFWNCWRC